MNIDVTGPGSYSWDIDIDPTSLSTSTEYVLRFTTPGRNYDNIYVGVSNIPSPGFVVLLGAGTSSPTTSTPACDRRFTNTIIHHCPRVELQQWFHFYYCR